jgi:hypothetical protein
VAKTEQQKESIEKGSHPARGFMTIEESREFYRDGYRLVLKMLAGSVLLNLLFFAGSAMAIYVALHKKPLIVAVNPSMQVLPVVPLSAPYVSNAGAAAWATKALESTMDISFSEWQKNLGKASRYYIPAAYTQLIAGLKSSGILQKIVDQRLNTVLMPVSAAYVVKSGAINGVPAWIIRGTFQLTYQGTTNDEGEQSVKVEFIVQRANILTHPSGLVIRSIVLGG